MIILQFKMQKSTDIDKEGELKTMVAEGREV